MLQEDNGNALWTGYDVSELVLNLQDCLRVATSVRFEKVVKGWFFAIHPVIFARTQHDLFPPGGL